MKKKVKLLIILMMSLSLTISASSPMLDYNSSDNTNSSPEYVIADGFYHIKNVGTGRYMSYNDTDPGNYKVSESGSINLAGIRTYINYDSVAVSPSCVIYVKQLGNGTYDFCAQGSSFYTMTGERMPLNITSNGDGSYFIWGTYKGFTKYFVDKSPSTNDGNLVSTETGMTKWEFIPINTSNEYIGIHPDVKTADGTYYGTIYAGFNFRLASPGMAAYYVSDSGGTEFSMVKIESDVIPKGTPVIVKCNSADPQDNKIEPVMGGYNFDHTNCLRGVYCSLYVAGHHNVTRFDDTTMRILGLNDDGELAFIANPSVDRLYKEQYLMANKAYLVVNPSDADILLAKKITYSQKCATPIISYADNKLSFNCETDGATCHYTITNNDVRSGSGNEIQLGMRYHVTAYATKAEFENSDVAAMDIVIISNGQAIVIGDVNGDGVVNVADHVTLSDIIMSSE